MIRIPLHETENLAVPCKILHRLVVIVGMEFKWERVDQGVFDPCIKSLFDRAVGRRKSGSLC